MINRADRFTQRTAVDEVYSDVPLNFDRNPVTGNLAKVTNEEAVKGSLRQIVLAMRGEWPHYPGLGSNVYRALFEPLDSVSADLIMTTALQAIAANEPRARTPRVDVRPSTQEDGYEITIYFYLVNSTVEYSVTELLRRVR